MLDPMDMTLGHTDSSSLNLLLQIFDVLVIISSKTQKSEKTAEKF